MADTGGTRGQRAGVADQQKGSGVGEPRFEQPKPQPPPQPEPEAQTGGPQIVTAPLRPARHRPG
jgi:hypothetical protein